MPSKLDLVFYIAPIAVKTDHLAFTVQLNPAKPTKDLSHTNRASAPIIEEWVSDSEDDYETTASRIAHSSVQSTKQVTPHRHSVQPVEAPILAITPKLTCPKTSCSGKKKNRKTCFVCRIRDHLIKDCKFHDKPQTKPSPRNYAYRGFYKQRASFSNKYPQKHIEPAAVLPKSKSVSFTAVRPICADVPKIMMTRPRHAHSLNTRSNSTIRRHKTSSHSLNTRNSSLKATAAKAPVVSAAKGKKGKWVWRPKFPILDHDSRTTDYFSTHKTYQAEEEPANFALMVIPSSSSSDNESLTKLLANQTNGKHSLGYSSLENDSESVSPSYPFNRVQPSGRYNVVPPPIIGNLMPPKPDLVFHTALIAVETNHLAFTVQLGPAKPAEDLSHINRPSAPIIEE
nr:hypothetical protein [Tanacetum cinerariifolium]